MRLSIFYFSEIFAWVIGRQDIQGYNLLRDRLFLSPFSSFLSTGIIDRVKGLGFYNLVNHVGGRVAFLWLLADLKVDSY